MVSSASFNEALAAVDSGDLSELARLLEADPSLVRARSTEEIAPYDGYFHSATLLHHVAGNPTRRPLPENILEVARLLLESGAKADAATDFGEWSWTTLGLVCTSSELLDRNLDLSMIDLLLDYGADPNWGNGLPLYGALFHVTEDVRLLRPARYLVIRGAEMDLATAAGVGSIDTVRELLDSEPFIERSYRLYRMEKNRLQPLNRETILSEALLFASFCGQTECARLLLQAGADPNRFVSSGHTNATPLHWAAYTGSNDVIELLLQNGADRTLVDPVYNATPVGWARHRGRERAADLLERA